MPELEDETSLNINQTLARVFGFLGRRRWWIVAPFCFTAVGTVGVLGVLPNLYTSTATLLVVEQQVPQRYVVPNSETDLTSALQAMKQEVLSRTQLLRMINDFGLYPKQRKRLAPDQLAELMNRNIDILPMSENPQQRDKGFDSFKISFTTENAVVAQQVTNNLTSLFINEYLRAGTEQSSNTTNFLHQQVDAKSKELQAQEERLRDFKLSHVGELPEQQPGNLGILAGFQGQLRDTMTSLNRAKEHRALLQAQFDAIPKRRPSLEGSIPLTIPGAGIARITPVEAAQNEVTRLEAQRSVLLNKGYTPSHPDVVKNDREMASAQNALKRLLAALPPPERNPSGTQAPAASRQVEVADDPAATQLKSSLEANRVEIENLTKEETQLKAQIGQYENRINQTPVREQQEAGILRDVEVLRQQYSELQKKEQESQLATNLEKQQGGQQFRLIDPASLPSVPSSPKRGKIASGGVIGGLVLGLALAVLMEMRDTSFHDEKNLNKHLAAAFVLGIPVLPTRAEERRRKWRAVVQWAAASAMLSVVAAAEFYVYRQR